MSSKFIYISGPMTGLPDNNFPAFYKAAESLAEAGWQPINPAENFCGRRDLPREIYLRADVQLLARCDAIALLDGWQRSRGAGLEYLIAQELGLELIHQRDEQWWRSSPKPHQLASVMIPPPWACAKTVDDKNQRREQDGISNRSEIRR